MVCPEEQLVGNTEFLRQFNARVRRNRVPLHGSMDLTYRCNLRCVHCYACPPSDPGGRARAELATPQVISILDQVAEAGCLFFLITGGEPLMREDFPEVYRHAKRRGLMVTVFTNGTRVDDTVLSLFGELPPLGVEISIYGAAAGAHDRVTGVEGSFDLSMRAVRRLMDRGIRVVLKTILMTLNRGELAGMERLARDLGLKFRFDAMIVTRLNGDRAPLEVRASPEQAVEGEWANPSRAEEWRRYAGSRTGKQAESDKLYTCGAGVACFHIDPYGNLYPCLMARSVSYNLAQGAFLDGWRNVVPRIRDEEAPPGFLCNQCDKKVFCSACPATFALEGGTERGYYAFMCEVADRRATALRAGA